MVVSRGGDEYLRGAQFMFAQLDIELENHQGRFVECGHHAIAHPLHLRALERGPHPFEDDLLSAMCRTLNSDGLTRDSIPSWQCRAGDVGGQVSSRVAQVL